MMRTMVCEAIECLKICGLKFGFEDDKCGYTEFGSYSSCLPEIATPDGKLLPREFLVVLSNIFEPSGDTSMESKRRVGKGCESFNLSKSELCCKTANFNKRLQLLAPTVGGAMCWA
eukprot:4261875-Karenia_brevis.AAC.1